MDTRKRREVRVTRKGTPEGTWRERVKGIKARMGHQYRREGEVTEKEDRARDTTGGTPGMENQERNIRRQDKNGT